MEEDNSKSVNKTLLVFIILLILVVIFIFASYIFGVGKGYFVYNGVGGKYRIDKIKFGNMTDYYLNTNISGKYHRFPFRNDPKNLEKIYLEPNIKNKIINKKLIYVTQDVDEIGPKSLIGKIEFIGILGYNEDLGGIYKLNLKSAFTSKVENVSVISCKDVSKNVGVIYLNLGDENKIYSENDCIIIQGTDDNNLLLSSEKFAYHLLNVF